MEVIEHILSLFIYMYYSTPLFTGFAMMLAGCTSVGGP